MKKILRTTLAVSIALALTACNNGDKYVEPATMDIMGSAVKGSLRSATVLIYRATDTTFATPLTTEPEDIQTKGDGSYEATVVDASGNAIVGALVVKIIADDNTEMRCDAAVECADGTPRGEWIPNSEVRGLELSTVTEAKVDANGASVPVDADANILTTMATDAVLAQVTANPALDLNDSATFAAAQQNASTVVGEMLGVNLSTVSIFDVVIADSTDTQAVADATTAAGDTASVTSTLTSLNASFSNLNPGSKLTDSITSYVQSAAVVSTAVVGILAAKTPGVDVDITAGLAGNQAAQDALHALAASQAALSGGATLIQDKVQMDINGNADIELVIDKVVIITVVPPIKVDLNDDNTVVVVTGASGGNSGANSGGF